MDEVMGGILGIIGTVTSKSFGAARRAIAGYDGRQVRWPTVIAAAFAASLYVPMFVGACFAIGASWEIFQDDFFWVASLFIGMFVFLIALLLLALAGSAVGLGVTIGAWLLVDRPAARWYAGFHAAGAMATALFVLSMETWVTRVVGWSTVGLAAALVMAVLLPQGEIAPPPIIEPAAPTPEVVDPFTSPPERAGRFVL